MYLTSFYQMLVEEHVVPWAKDMVRPAMEGDHQAAADLVRSIDGPSRAYLAIAFWHAKIPRSVFRVVLEQVWSHDHSELIRAAATRRRLRAMFRYAQFDVSVLPQSFQVWRGIRSHQMPGLHYSWTTSRDIACWFAMRFVQGTRTPVVLTTQVSRDSVAMYTDERGEREVLVLDKIFPVTDGFEGDWRERYLAHQQQIQQQNRNLLGI